MASKPLTILGIGGYTYDAAACLLRDGEIVANIEEERFSRSKHHSGMANQAIKTCLEMGGVSPDDIDYISFCYKPWERIAKRVPYRLYKMFSHPVWSYRILTHEIGFVSNFLRELRLVKGSGTKVLYPGHHLCHAASSFYASPFDDAAILTVDQRGEWDTTVFALGQGEKIKQFKNIGYPHSLGVFYAAITHFLGFKPDSDEYKVMGLASYGDPVYLEEMRDILELTDEGGFKLNLKYLLYHLNRGFYRAPYWSEQFFEVFGPQRRYEEEIAQKHMDIAASAQKRLEEVFSHMAEYLYAQTGQKNLCIAGGVGMNGKANGELLESAPFDHIYLPYASADNGLAVGGALAIYHDILGHKRKPIPARADWGTQYSDDEIEHTLSMAKLEYQRSDEIVSDVADQIVSGKIVGWYQGRMECGARALGFRSILADPTRADMKDLINIYVKHREEFRPFAPAVLEEKAPEYFEISDPIPYMTIVVPVKEDKKSVIPAVTHVDGTARVQTVSKENNERFWNLLKAVEHRNGVPVILNTSFNVMGEPLVESPEQAIRTFFASGMDVLAIGSFLVTKSAQFAVKRDKELASNVA